MLSLPTVTLLAIDTVHPFLALDALIASTVWVRPAATLLLTNVHKHRGIASHAADHGVTVIQHTESDEFVLLPGLTRRFYPAYERAQVHEPLAHIGSSSHVLYMEADAGILNPEAWNPFWLSYDFIGAPWPRFEDPGYPPCDGLTNAVGNTGFSLRSRRFCEAAVACLAAHPTDPSSILTDAWLCRTMRPWLEREHGIQFAPPETAERFSCENRIYTNSFGFHGAKTKKMNGWNWP